VFGNISHPEWRIGNFRSNRSSRSCISRLSFLEASDFSERNDRQFREYLNSMSIAIREPRYWITFQRCSHFLAVPPLRHAVRVGIDTKFIVAMCRPVARAWIPSHLPPSSRENCRTNFPYRKAQITCTRYACVCVRATGNFLESTFLGTRVCKVERAQVSPNLGISESGARAAVAPPAAAAAAAPPPPLPPSPVRESARDIGHRRVVGVPLIFHSSVVGITISGTVPLRSRILRRTHARRTHARTHACATIAICPSWL